MNAAKKLSNPSAPRKQKDRFDILVDSLDKYYFRMSQAENVISGSTYTESFTEYGSLRESFETPRGKKSRKLFYENIKEVGDAELKKAIEETAIDWQCDEQDFDKLFGFVLGLRIAGIDSERAKAMARTWRFGFPQDDKVKRQAI